VQRTLRKSAGQNHDRRNGSGDFFNMRKAQVHQLAFFTDSAGSQSQLDIETAAFTTPIIRQNTTETGRNRLDQIIPRQKPSRRDDFPRLSLSDSRQMMGEEWTLVEVLRAKKLLVLPEHFIRDKFILFHRPFWNTKITGQKGLSRNHAVGFHSEPHFSR